MWLRARPGNNDEASPDRALTGVHREPGVAAVRQLQAMEENLFEVVLILVNHGRDRLSRSGRGADASYCEDFSIPRSPVTGKQP